MFKKREKKKEVEIPTASTSDIAFLLLVFFMVTTNFDTEKGISMILPPIGEDTKVKRSNVLTVLCGTTGEVMIDDVPVATEEIQEIVRERIKENPDKLIIVLKTHPEAPYNKMIDILDELKLARAPRISLSILEM